MRRPAASAVLAVCAVAAFVVPNTSGSPSVAAQQAARFRPIDQLAARTRGGAGEQLLQRLDALTRNAALSGFGLSGTQRQAPTAAMNARLVSATVLLQGDSVIGARTRAQRSGVPYDAAATQRRIQGQQRALLPALRAAGATVRRQVSHVLNAVTVQVPYGRLGALAATPGVARVHLSYTLEAFNGTSDTYTGTPTVWGGSAPLGQTGAGMVIGIIDDGIDYTHADFGGSGDPADYLANDPTTLTDAPLPPKVIGGYDFVGDDYSANPEAGQSDVPAPDADPLACGEHGTHVAGTAAGAGVLGDGSTFTGPYNSTTLTSNTFAVAPGAAPEASIRAYKVFGCAGSVADDIIIAAIEQAVIDDVDVLNLSLGSAWGGADAADPLSAAVDAATAAGVLSVISAGNSGSGPYLVGAPSTANTALSVAASDTSSPLINAVTIYGPATLTVQNSNQFGFPLGSISGDILNVGLGCAPSDYAGTSGKIAVAVRGTCDRIDRAIFGDAAGAKAVIFVNDAESFPPVEGPIAGVDIPFVGVPASVGDLLIDGTLVTLENAGITSNPRYTWMADFSSNGPRLDNALKPDITAPGVSMWSAFVGSGTDGVRLSGTSMAAPHAAGIATLVRQAHPTWSPQMVKGVLMATADPTRIGDYDTMRSGAGMIDAPAAAASLATITTTDGLNNLSFGFIESAESVDVTRSFTLHNTSGTAVTYDFSASFNSHVTVPPTTTITPSSVLVAAGGTAVVNVRLTYANALDLPTAADSDAGALAAIDGLVQATPRTTPTGIRELIVPLLLIAQGNSNVRTTTATNPQLRRTLSPQLVKRITIRNRSARDTNYDTYQWAMTDDSGDAATGVPDIRDVGVQSYSDGTDEVVVFAISTEGRIPTHTIMEYDIPIDVDDDLIEDFVVIGIDEGLLFDGSPNGVMVSLLIDVRSTATVVSGYYAAAPANGSTIELPALLADLEASPGTPLHFYASSWSVLADLPSDATDEGWFDPWNPAVNSGDFDTVDFSSPFVLRTQVDLSDVAAQHALGWLVVALDDAAGTTEVDRVPLRVNQLVRGIG